MAVREITADTINMRRKAQVGTLYCEKAELENPTLESFTVNPASFPAEHKRVVQMDSVKFVQIRN